MKRFIGCLAAALTSGVIGSSDGAGPALAQTPGTAGPISLGQVFESTDSTDLTPEGQVKLLRAAPPLIPPPDECPQQAKFTVIVGQGDAIFQDALGAARREVVEAFLFDAGACAIHCPVEHRMGSRDGVEVDYSRIPDREPPALHTDSEPEKGSKVSPGDDIVVTMTARDDANRWQTGIQSVQLGLVGPDGDIRERVGGEDFRPVVRENCEGRPEPRTVTLRYTVPDDPPPFLRFVAIAEDFANQFVSDSAEFSTGTLGGIWRDEANGKEVYLVQSDNNVSAYYVEWRTCDHRNGTGGSSNSFFDFSGTMQGDRIEGEIEVCKWGTPDAGMIRVPVKLTVADNAKSLSGEWHNTVSQTWVPISFTWLRDE